MKQTNWPLILIFLTHICLIQPNSELLTFGQASSFHNLQNSNCNNFTRNQNYQSPSFTTSANSIKPLYTANQVQLARAKFGRINSRTQPNYYHQLYLLTLANQQILNPSDLNFTNPNQPSESALESNYSPELSRCYPVDYNPFLYDYVSEKLYDLRAYFSSKYRTEQEQKYPYLIHRRHKLEHDQQLVRDIIAAKNLRLSPAATKLVHNYNDQLNLLNLPASMDNQISDNFELENLAGLMPYDLQISPDFFQAKFNQPEQQLLHARQLEILNTIADHKIFASNIIGLQDFSNTVLETIAIAYQANRINKIEIATVFTDLASDFTALGRGLINGGCNFAGNIIQASDSLISHPLDTTQAVIVNLGNLTKNVAVGLLKTLIVVVKSIEDPKTIKPNLLALHDSACELCEQFYDYIETVPRAEKFEKIGTVVSEQLLALAANIVTGKTITFVSESVAAAQLHKAIIAKKKHDEVKSGQAKVTWLNKFGRAGRDAAQTLGLVATEEYELATLDGLIINVKTHPTTDQTLFKQSEGYFKHNNKSGKKSKPRAKIANTSTEPTLSQLHEINQGPIAILKNGYYEVNGFRFTEYYYNRLWDNGRPVPSLLAKGILDSNPKVFSDYRPGFFRYEIDNWEMVYNPATKEIHHMRPKY